MGTGNRKRGPNRASVPVTPFLRQVLTHPTQFGLAPRVSEARAILQLAEKGARQAAEDLRYEAEVAAYAAYAADPERQAVASDIQRAALESGAM